MEGDGVTAPLPAAFQESAVPCMSRTKRSAYCGTQGGESGRSAENESGGHRTKNKEQREREREAEPEPEPKPEAEAEQREQREQRTNLEQKDAAVGAVILLRHLHGETPGLNKAET